MAQYKLDQVLYVADSSTGTVQPYVITEEIVKATRSGKNVSYMVQFKDNEPTSLDSISGEIFESANVARKTLNERASTAINALIDVATENAKLWYSTTKEKQPVCPPPPENVPQRTDKYEQSDALVDMGDGTKVRVTLPKELQ